LSSSSGRRVIEKCRWAPPITRLPEDDDNFKAGVAINPYLLFLAAVP